MTSSLTFARLVADSVGESHFESFEVEITIRNFAPPAPSFGVSEFMPASQCGFLNLPKGWVGDLHPSPLRMWVFLLSGEMEFEGSNGEKRHVSMGGALLLEDTTGKGHRSWVVGNSEAVLALVQL